MNGTGGSAAAAAAAKFDSVLDGLSYNNSSNTAVEGNRVFSIVATDNAGTPVSSTAVTMTVTVDETNDTPTVVNAIADQSTAEDALFTYQVPANTFEDLDGDTLTYGITGLPSSGNLSFDASTRTVSGTPNNTDIGVHAVTVKATDGDGAFAEDTFNITVTNVNDQPVVTLDTTGSGAAANAATFVESEGVDANDNQVSFVKGTGASIEDVDTGDLLGTLKVDFAHNLAASDQLIIAGGGSSGADVAVALNTANGGNGTVTVNSVAYTYTVANDGSSAASISFAPASAVSPAEMDNLLKALQYNNTSDTPTGQVVFGVSVTDDSGSSATNTTAATSAVANFTVTLQGTNDIPTVVTSQVTIDSVDYAVDNSLEVTEKTDNAADENTATLTNTGVVNFADLDFNTGTASIALVSAKLVETSTPSNVLSPNVTPKGSLAVTGGAINDEAGNINKSVPLTFTVPGGDLDSLEGGTSIEQVYSITYSDGTATAVQNVTVMVNGSKDGPTVDLKTADSGTVDLAATFTESNADDTGGVKKKLCLPMNYHLREPVLVMSMQVLSLDTHDH